jgi:cytochrome P450
MFIWLNRFEPSSQEITTYRHRFPKPISRYRVLTVFGPNIVASEGEEWKKYRKITAPAFSEVCHEPYLLLNPE